MCVGRVWRAESNLLVSGALVGPICNVVSVILTDTPQPLWHAHRDIAVLGQKKDGEHRFGQIMRWQNQGSLSHGKWVIHGIGWFFVCFWYDTWVKSSAKGWFVQHSFVPIFCTLSNNINQWALSSHDTGSHLLCYANVGCCHFSMLQWQARTAVRDIVPPKQKRGSHRARLINKKQYSGFLFPNNFLFGMI